MRQDTSWNRVGKWYGKIVGEEGHYYHRQIILPNVARIMKLGGGEKILDLGCGNGVLNSIIDERCDYLGIDLAKNLVDSARKNYPQREFMAADVAKEMNVGSDFDWVTIILALQNIKKPFVAIRNAAKALKNSGKILIVLNHPCFRIPRFSSWGIDENVQYRRVDGYMIPKEIAIEANPSKGRLSERVYSFHYPLSAYVEMLADNGFLVEKMEEWVSDKRSTGSKSKMEDRARAEIPMFLGLVGRKI